MMPKAILERPELTPGTKLVYAVIVDAMRDKASSWPGIRTIAAACGLAPSSVAESIRRLEEAGFLAVEHRSRKANLYRKSVQLEGAPSVPKTERAVPEIGTDLYRKSVQKKTRRRKKTNNTPLPPKGGGSGFDPISGATACMSLGSHLACDQFASAWREWVDHRRTIRKRLTEAGVKGQIKMLEGLTLDQAIESIHTAIRSGWTGVFPPKGTKHQPTADRTGQAWKETRYIP